jgi:hypothetical protein
VDRYEKGASVAALPSKTIPPKGVARKTVSDFLYDMNIGKILAYSDDASAGAIKTDDGTQYYFSKAEWEAGDKTPLTAGLTVTFQAGPTCALKVRTAG